MQDWSLYDSLGVPPTAEDADIRRAYRQQAKTCHPDLFPGDAQAEARFREINRAFDILGQAERRKQYDAGEIDADGEPVIGWDIDPDSPEPDYGKPENRPLNDEELEDLLREETEEPAELPDDGMPRRGQDIHQTLELDFLNAVRGGRHTITMTSGTSATVTVPPGLDSGETMRVVHLGHPGLNEGERGDLILTISVRRHWLFTRENDDILVDLPLSEREAREGMVIALPTIHGLLSVTVPAEVTDGERLLLRGHGVRRDHAPAGHQRVRVRIVPEASRDELRALWRNLA